MDVERWLVRARRVANLARARRLAVLHRGLVLGRGVQVGRWARIIVADGGRIELGDGVELDDGCTVAAVGGVVVLEPGVFVGHHCTLAARRHVHIGARSFLAELVSVRDHDHDPDLPPSSGAVLVDPVDVGADVWVAAKATVTRGVTIGDRSVVAANAVVRDDVPAGVLVGGIPARVLRGLVR